MTADALRDVARIMQRHTHQGIWVMSRFAGPDPEHDCLLCRALVAAGVLTLEDIGTGTRAALAASAPRAKEAASAPAPGGSERCAECGHLPHQGECGAEYREDHHDWTCRCMPVPADTPPAPASGGSERCGYWYQYDRVECGYPESDPIHDDGRLGHAFFRRPVPADTPPVSAPAASPEAVWQYERALRHIRDDLGKVCNDYADCSHEACSDSYAAWAAADAALTLAAHPTPAPVAPAASPEAVLPDPRWGDGWTFEPLTGDGWAICPPEGDHEDEYQQREDGSWGADGYGCAIALNREDAVRIVNALNAAHPTPVALDVAKLSRILRDGDIGCEDHRAECATGDRRQHTPRLHREDAEYIAAAYAEDRP